MAIATIDAALEALAGGRMIILADDEQRENEGDFVMVAQLATKEAITFMAEQARTIITLALTGERCDRLKLPLLDRDPLHSQDTAFTATIEAATGVTTGSSAADRLRTIRAAVAPDAAPEDLVRPGHVFPLRAAPGGVLNRAGHTEAACDLARLAGFEPAGLISEIQLPSGEMARMPDLQRIAEEHDLPLTTIAKLIEHRCSNESLLVRGESGEMDTAWGRAAVHRFRDTATGSDHIALECGEIGEAPLVRVLVNPGVLEALAMRSEGRSWTAAAALSRMAEAGGGVLVCLHVDSPAGFEQLRRQDQDADSHQVRNYGIGAQILRELGVRRMRLLSSPVSMPSMGGFGLEVVETLAAPEAGDG